MALELCAQGVQQVQGVQITRSKGVTETLMTGMTGLALGHVGSDCWQTFQSMQPQPVSLASPKLAGALCMP